MSLDAFGLSDAGRGQLIVRDGHGHALKRLGDGCTYCGVCHFAWAWKGSPEDLARLPWVGRLDPFLNSHCSDCRRQLLDGRCVACDPRCSTALDLGPGQGAICINPPHLATDQVGNGHVWSKTYWNILHHPQDASRWNETGASILPEPAVGEDESDDEADEAE